MPPFTSRESNVTKGTRKSKTTPDGDGGRHPAFSRTRSFEKRKDAIIQSSIQLFNKHGFHATSISQISKELGLSSAAVYYYFKDKYDLLYNCYLFAVHNGLEVARAVDRTQGTGLEKLETYIREQFRALVGEEGSAWIFSDLTVLNPEQREEMVKLSREVDKLVLGFIEQGQSDGSLAVAQPRITEFFILGALNWVPRWYRSNMKLDADDLAEVFLQLVFEGLRPRR